MNTQASRSAVPEWISMLLVAVLLAATVAASVTGASAGPATAGVVTSNGATLYVDWEAAGSDDGSSWDDAFVDLQLALDAAAPGDEIWVAAGTYYPSVEHGGEGDRYKSFQMVNGVGLYGGFDPTVGDVVWEDRDWVSNAVVLSGDLGTPGDIWDNCFHVFYHPEATALDAGAILDGFTVSDGNADGFSPLTENGGGMLNVGSSPSLSNCVFEDNEAFSWGGGLYNESASPTVTDCAFQSNRAWYDGGGVYNASSHAVFEGCRFVANWAYDFGGGVFNSQGSPAFSNCEFVDNVSEWSGGAMANYEASPEVTNSTFVGNETLDPDFGGTEGGAIWNRYSSPVLTNCTAARNHADGYGGATANRGSSLTATNCTFHDNDAPDGGGAVHNGPIASSSMANSIFWENTPDQLGGDGHLVEYSDVQGGHPGEGNIDADPCWVDPGSGDYRLGGDSQSIDAGTNDAPYLPVYDFEGDDRIMDGDGDGTPVVDMGIDEALPPVAISGLRARNDSPTLLGFPTTLTATVQSGTRVSYKWAFGDGESGTGPNVIHTYAEAGLYIAVVTATNGLSTASDTTDVDVFQLPGYTYLPVVRRGD